MSGCKLPLPVWQALQELRQFLRKFYGERFRALILYGSNTRGDFPPDSGVDVLIALAGEVRPGQEIDRIGNRVADLGLEYNFLITTFPVPEEGLQVRKSPLFEYVRREGIYL